MNETSVGNFYTVWEVGQFVTQGRRREEERKKKGRRRSTKHYFKVGLYITGLNTIWSSQKNNECTKEDLHIDSVKIWIYKLETFPATKHYFKEYQSLQIIDYIVCYIGYTH